MNERYGNGKRQNRADEWFGRCWLKEFMFSRGIYYWCRLCVCVVDQYLIIQHESRVNKMKFLLFTVVAATWALCSSKLVQSLSASSAEVRNKFLRSALPSISILPHRRVTQAKDFYPLNCSKWFILMKKQLYLIAAIGNREAETQMISVTRDKLASFVVRSFVRDNSEFALFSSIPFEREVSFFSL